MTTSRPGAPSAPPGGHPTFGAPGDGPEVLVFDLYGTLVDPLDVVSTLGEVIPGDEAADVAALWRRTQLDYAFRLTLMGRYRTFEWVTARALDHALDATGHDLADEVRRALLQAYDRLALYPDVRFALELLVERGHDCYVLSNGSPGMLRRSLESAGLTGFFSGWISVDEVGAFKPAPQVYRHAGEVIGRVVTSMRMVSCNPFDVVGAAAAGMRTAWVNRSGRPFDRIGERPDLMGSDLVDLAHRITAVSA